MAVQQRFVINNSAHEISSGVRELKEAREVAIASCLVNGNSASSSRRISSERHQKGECGLRPLILVDAVGMQSIATPTGAGVVKHDL